MQRSITYLVSAIFLALVISACQAVPPQTVVQTVEVEKIVEVEVTVEPGDAAAAESTGPTKIVLMRFFGDCFDEFGDNTDLETAYGECGIIQTMTNVFNASQDEVIVETQPVDWPGFAELNANLAAGTPPDIMVLHGYRIPNYASRGLLTPLGDGMTAGGIDTDDFTQGARGNVEYEGELYGLPLDQHGHLWHINVGLWEEAGLVDDSGNPILPVGEAEFLEAAAKFKEATGKPFVATWTNGLSRNWMALVYQQGGSIEIDEGAPNIDTAEGLVSLNFLLKLRDEGYIPDNVDYTATQELFLNGEVGSLWNGTWVVNFYDEQTLEEDSGLKDYYVSSFTQIYDQPAAWAGTHTWIVPQGLDPDPAKMEATLKFFKYLNDNNLQWAHTGHQSVNKSILASPEYNALPHRDEYAAFANDAVVMPRSSWVTAFETVLDEEIQAVLIGDKGPEEALADAQSRLDDFAAFGE
jgi:multiple sugar transport system substrate-binding protein